MGGVCGRGGKEWGRKGKGRKEGSEQRRAIWGDRHCRAVVAVRTRERADEIAQPSRDSVGGAAACLFSRSVENFGRAKGGLEKRSWDDVVVCACVLQMRE